MVEVRRGGRGRGSRGMGGGGGVVEKRDHAPLKDVPVANII